MPEFEIIELPQKYTSVSPVEYQYFNQLFNHRTIIMNEDICENIVESFYVPLRDFEMDDSDEPITVIFNCSGGSVSDGFFVANYLTKFKKKLKIIVAGYAASMAAVLLAAGGKNDNITRYCYPSTYLLLHDGYVALQTSEAKTAADFMTHNNMVDGEIRQFFIDNTNIDPELYDSMTRRQWFIDANKAKELNLVDKIIGVDCDNDY